MEKEILEILESFTIESKNDYNKIYKNSFEYLAKELNDLFVLGGVNRSLPRYKEISFEADEQANKKYEKNEDESDAYFLGFINCLKYIKDRIKSGG